MKPSKFGLIVVFGALLLCGTRATSGEAQSVNTTTNSASPSVIISTSMGDIEVELNAEKAPISVKNFLSYVDDKFYDGLIFHRVIPNFMIQGGGMKPDMSQKETKAQIKNEAANGLKNTRGTLAMARTNVPDSATAQFFINHADNSFLDYRGPGPSEIGYAVFGKVTKGMEVVDKIAAVKTKTAGYHENVPVESVMITSIHRK
jgi:peptidyl-prolyl cis-trans isomerase A (cyclophilin A)